MIIEATDTIKEHTVTLISNRTSGVSPDYRLVVSRPKTNWSVRYLYNRSDIAVIRYQEALKAINNYYAKKLEKGV